jgi:hypothetical protein
MESPNTRSDTTPDTTSQPAVERHLIAESYAYHVLYSNGLIQVNDESATFFVGRLALDADKWIQKDDIISFYRERAPHMTTSHILSKINKVLNGLRVKMIQAGLALIEVDPALEIYRTSENLRVRLIGALLPEVKLDLLRDDIINRARKEHRMSAAISLMDTIRLQDDPVRRFVLKVVSKSKEGYLPHPQHKERFKKSYDDLRALGHEELIDQQEGRYSINPKILAQFEDSFSIEPDAISLDGQNLNLPIISEDQDNVAIPDEKKVKKPFLEEGYNNIVKNAIDGACIRRLFSKMRIHYSKHKSSLFLKLAEFGELKLIASSIKDLIKGPSSVGAIWDGVRAAVRSFKKAELIEVDQAEIKSGMTVRLIPENLPSFSDDEIKEILKIALLEAKQRLSISYSSNYFQQCFEAYRGKTIFEIFQTEIPERTNIFDVVRTRLEEVLDDLDRLAGVEAEAEERAQRVNRAEERAEEAEVGRAEAEERAEQAEKRAQRAEEEKAEALERVERAEAEKTEAIERAERVEAEKDEALARAERAEAETAEALERAEKAEAKRKQKKKAKEKTKQTKKRGNPAAKKKGDGRSKEELLVDRLLHGPSQKKSAKRKKKKIMISPPEATPKLKREERCTIDNIADQSFANLAELRSAIVQVATELHASSEFSKKDLSILITKLEKIKESKVSGQLATALGRYIGVLKRIEKRTQGDFIESKHVSSILSPTF